jgi:hypothetical protein
MAGIEDEDEFEGTITIEERKRSFEVRERKI